MHDMMQKIKAGDKESIAIVLLEAPDRGKDHKMSGSSPEEYAAQMVDESYGKDQDEDEKNDPLKESILGLLEPIPMPDDIRMEICKVIYDAINSGQLKGDDASV
tara:strand:- start:5576 stop:5887 length:312 start_codon:yes stop_codon:yes gene_type:complete